MTSSLRSLHSLVMGATWLSSDAYHMRAHGQMLGVGGRMKELRRVRSGHVKEDDDIMTLNDVPDAQWMYDNTKNESQGGPTSGDTLDHGEAIALGIAQMTMAVIATCGHGVIVEHDTYPEYWRLGSKALESQERCRPLKMKDVAEEDDTKWKAGGRI
ncbi:MAG: hypothetical protein J3Q66DRAFT_399147 [Benniella sp.]|nr:MAG: hypothetical protein J3Q66DRAFT_399147 [Benniella sp.]